MSLVRPTTPVKPKRLRVDNKMKSYEAQTSSKPSASSISSMLTLSLPATP
ncbi:MAG: hypothetical protein RXS23_01955 [Metallosphaera yellowstonensis]